MPRLPTALLGLALALPPVLAAAGADARAVELRDRVVAVVDEDPILLSDVERVVAFGLVARLAGESTEELQRRVLDGLIDQRLRYHEVDRYGFATVPAEAVDAHLEAIRARFASDDAYRRRLAELGMSEEALRLLVVRQLEVAAYIEELLGARVFVGLEEIEEHYEQELAPRLAAAGQPVPPLPEIRESIRQLLREGRLNQELDRWTSELRAKADVVDLLPRPDRRLPPVQATQVAPPTPDAQ